MKLDLKEIINIPGGRVAFSRELSASVLSFPQIIRYIAAPMAEGEVRNSAGALSVSAEITATMLCICDRCGAEFPSVKELSVEVPISVEAEPENPEAFSLEGNFLDIDELLETALILDMETKFLCSEDCKGICSECGKNLNEGPCSCGKKTDPRLAVLEQLLDIEKR
ncbi:MAG: DUF177 domain-containing protein [Oscillospiraceae bacterium]